MIDKDKLAISEGNIIFENVNFIYKSNPQNRVLQNVNANFAGWQNDCIGWS